MIPIPKQLEVLMKLSFIALVFSFSLSIFASTSKITCLVKENFENKSVNIKVEFLVKNLGSSKAELVQHPKASEESGAILISPEQVNGQFSNMTHLNGQGGDLRVSNDRIRLFGDGDGYTFVDLVLFKDTNYQKGFVRVYGSGDQFYQKINCSVN